VHILKVVDSALELARSRVRELTVGPAAGHRRCFDIVPEPVSGAGPACWRCPLAHGATCWSASRIFAAHISSAFVPTLSTRTIANLVAAVDDRPIQHLDARAGCGPCR